MVPGFAPDSHVQTSRSFVVSTLAVDFGMTSSWLQLLSDYFHVLAVLAVVVAVIIFISSVDDLIVDAYYWVHALTRRILGSKDGPASIEELHQRGEQPLAIMVPAWQEHDVISKMLENMVEVLDYRDYTIFVGTYVNDPDTIGQVERMRRRYRHLVRVEVPNPGPTCKADCLNWLIQAILLHEKHAGRQFAGIVLHDSEDVLHPLELRLFNYYLPDCDMVQIPVWSLERRWHELVAGSYMDEFAEAHGKDMIVRESMASAIPSAGVGTCFSLRALAALAAKTNNQPFNTQTLTEDYDIGARLSRLGMRVTFARVPVEFQHSLGGARPSSTPMVAPLCTREYFPKTFRAAYRQRARWILGICLLGWRQFGWSGSLAEKYWLFRDRKALVTAVVTMLAYFLTLNVLVFHFVGAAREGTPLEAPWLLTSTGWLMAVIYANGGALVLRAFHRWFFVTRLYGWGQGILAIPRMIVSNFINFFAVARAWRLYLGHVFLGRRIVWDKTMHEYPSSEALAHPRQRLGEILVAWRVIDDGQLRVALDMQAHTGLPLGRILIRSGWIDENTLSEAIAYQANLSTVTYSPELVLKNAGALPLSTCERLRIVPLGVQSGRLHIGVGAPLINDDLGEVKRIWGQDPIQIIIGDTYLMAGLDVLRNQAISGEPANDERESREGQVEIPLAQQAAFGA
jgi:bacteriophage N4 adsorption protein B